LPVLVRRIVDRKKVEENVETEKQSVRRKKRENGDIDGRNNK
jgi:hypothetical protein